MTDFEQSYLALRDKEGRRFTDAQLLALPEVEVGHPQAQEWRLRSLSCARLLACLKPRGAAATVLEVGCGNGWLARRMALHCEVTATDVLAAEIDQARRAFSCIPKLSFVLGGLPAAELQGRRFDFIVFAASLQYFADPAAVLADAVERLKPDGEIHILDSPFYAEADLPGACERSARHFEALGHAELQAHYHHHRLDALSAFDPETLYTPQPGNGDTPFPWLRIVKSTP